MKKKRKLNLRKRKIVNISSLYKITGGDTLGCVSNTCPSETSEETRNTAIEDTCPTLTTVPASFTCPMSESGSNVDTTGEGSPPPTMGC
jgi:hypothetical protein